MKVKLISIASLAAAVVSAQAGSFFGLNDLTRGGGIYSIDAATGGSTLVAYTGGHNIQGNALAYNNAGTFYYAAGGALYQSTLGDLSNTSFVRNLVGYNGSGYGSLTDVTNAAFYNGSYYYVSGNYVNILNLSSGVTSFIDPSGVSNLGGFGDIAIQGGILYGSTTNGNFFKVDLATPFQYTLLGNQGSPSLQLGFNQGSLYGIATDSDAIFSVDSATGARTTMASLLNGNLRIVDAASSPVPEPFTMALGVMGLAAYARKRRASKKSA